MVRALVDINFALTLWTYEKAKSKLGNAHQRTKIQIEWQGDTRNNAVVTEPAIEYNQM